MDNNAPITGAPTRAPNFAAFNLARIDELHGELDTLKSLIWVAIDLVSAGGAHGENLLHAALNQYQVADDQLQAIHSDLMPIHHAARHAPSANVSPELARLIRDADAAEVACERHNEDVWVPANAAFARACDAIPHIFITGGDFDGLGPLEYSTDKPGMIAVARQIAKLSRNDAGVQEARDFLASHKRRERVIARLRRVHNLDALREESDQLGYKAADAIDAAVSFSCRSVADLNAKMVKVMDWQAMENEGTPAIIAADVARLAAGGAA